MPNAALATEPSLPPNLDAQVLYACKSLTKVGNVQAKCVYLHEGKQYPGIVFGSNNETWLKEIPSGTLVKTERVRPCTNPSYQGELMGDVMPIQVQSINKPIAILSYEDLPDMLRTAASIIEAFNKQQPAQDNFSASAKKDLPYRSVVQWAEIIKETIAKNDKFQTQPFSTIRLNAYLSTNFEDFWEGDIEAQANEYPRWQTKLSRAVILLVKTNFIVRIPGKKYHYRWNNDFNN